MIDSTGLGDASRHSMRIRFIAVIFCFSVMPLAYAEFGVGAAVGADQASILFPIKFESLIIEPFIGYSNSDSTRLNDVDREERLIGVGAFGMARPSDDLAVYFGARFAAFDDETVYGTPGTWNGRREEIDGELITPTFGVEYAVGKVTIGAEIGFEYEKAEETVSYSDDVGPGPLNVEVTSTERSRSTHASIVFRYFFQN